MRLRSRILAGAFGALLLGGAVVCGPTVWGKPWKIEHFYGRVFVEFALEHPMLLSQLGFLEAEGITFHQDDLDDFSVDATRRSTEMVLGNLEMLERYDRDTLEDPLSYDVLHWFLGDQAEGTKWAFHSYPVNQMSGFQSSLPDFMINSHRLEDEEGAEDYVARVSGFREAFSQTLESLRHREALGVLPPRFVMTRVLAEMRGFIEAPAMEHELYSHFAEKTAELTDLSADDRDELLAELAAEIENGVYPAYREMIEYFAALEPNAATDAGAWKLPDGEAFYAWKLRSFTTTELTPQEVHDIGLAEVARVQAEMKQILVAQGHDATDFGSAMQALNAQPKFLYPDDDDGRAQILADYQRIIDEIDANLDPMFSLRPAAKVTVERVPTFKETTAPGAYYNPPPLDRSKPGIFYANLRSVEEIPKFGMRTLAYHEAIPGHHFQIAIAQELEGVPFFRRIVPFTAYSEGWALYAEQVAAEAGFQEDPYDRLGYLTADLFRAARLVVDTGLHHKRWTRQAAIDWMLANTGMPRTDVVAEIERYIVMPGQACAYKIGKMKILELRERAREKLGASFDIRAFHAVILENGALPLTLLERVVDEWIAAG